MNNNEIKDLATVVEQNKWIMKEISGLKEDVKNLNTFKAKAAGIGAALGVAGGFLVEIIKGAMK